MKVWNDPDIIASNDLNNNFKEIATVEIKENFHNTTLLKGQSYAYITTGENCRIMHLSSYLLTNQGMKAKTQYTAGNLPNITSWKLAKEVRGIMISNYAIGYAYIRDNGQIVLEPSSDIYQNQQIIFMFPPIPIVRS